MYLGKENEGLKGPTKNSVWTRGGVTRVEVTVGTPTVDGRYGTGGGKETQTICASGKAGGQGTVVPTDVGRSGTGGDNEDELKTMTSMLEKVEVGDDG